jgi:hypothetical protein
MNVRSIISLSIELAVMSAASHYHDGPFRALGVGKPFQAI